MIALFQTIDAALQIFMWTVVAMIIYSWLFNFGIINNQNQFVRTVGHFLHQVTEPVLGPIRRFMPDLGGIDISPIVLFLIIFFIRSLIWNSIMPALA